MFFHYCSSAPVNTTKNSYSEFIEDLKSNKCVMPQEIQLPFQNPKLNNFEYLSSYLTICQNTKSTKRSKEAVILCKEIFDNLRNISCSTKAIALPDINIQLSQEVCGDIHALKSSVPENDGSLLKRLTDSFLCDIMCDGVFEKACQVLLWSYEVRKHIASVNTPNNEQMSDALEKITEGKKNNIPIEAHENESKLLNTTSKTSQSETVLKNSQTSGKVSSTDVADPSKDENQDNHLPDQTLEKSKDHKMQNQLTTPRNIVGTNSNLQENPSDQVNDPKTEDQMQEIAENGVDSNNNNELEQAENHNDLVSTGKGKKAKNDLKDASVNLPSNKGLSDDQAGNNQGSNMPTENEQNNAAGNNNENIANEETEKINDENDKAKNTIVNNKNETGTIATHMDQNTADTEVADEQTQKQGSENIAISKNEISSHKSNINNIDENTKNQAKVITTQGNTTDKTKNILNDQNPIPINTEKSDQTVSVSEKTSLKADPKSSPKDTTASKIPIPNSELPSVATESPSQAPTETTVALEKMEGENDGHQPADKEQPDQYTDDLENNGDDEEYSRPDYDGNLYDNTKTRESNPDIPNTVDIPAPKEVVTSQQEKPMEFPSRDSFGQETNDIQMIAAFPEQEDSHFFFYFLSFVLILMAGYLIFHNKQKIIALIVEGRHERNRRSHRAGYKKLETK
ncbi:uncharacterized protein TNIN_272491 [Trichonephila inaurata madagascariensis]|uniref:Uncharacterized protein n=1 Tax=Trichonephila inaurata madagascariensis TaxID=2747483 RepID=A0A8X7C0C1_9ARAC|nr:uncharacterized protein TNIN_272491 [Trichonephila inaurata madagascariensis]